MKKKYITPQTTAIYFQSEGIMRESDTNTPGSGTTPIYSEDDEENIDIGSKPYTPWGDEEEDPDGMNVTW